MPRSRLISEAERAARAIAERCEYSMFGNRLTCDCPPCASWRQRHAKADAKTAASLARARLKTKEKEQRGR
jgi:hypothetical protein